MPRFLRHRKKAADSPRSLFLVRSRPTPSGPARGVDLEDGARRIGWGGSRPQAQWQVHPQFTLGRVFDIGDESNARRVGEPHQRDDIRQGIAPCRIECVAHDRPREQASAPLHVTPGDAAAAAVWAAHHRIPVIPRAFLAEREGKPPRGQRVAMGAQAWCDLLGCRHYLQTVEDIRFNPLRAGARRVRAWRGRTRARCLRPPPVRLPRRREAGGPPRRHALHPGDSCGPATRHGC